MSGWTLVRPDPGTRKEHPNTGPSREHDGGMFSFTSSVRRIIAPSAARCKHTAFTCLWLARNIRHISMKVRRETQCLLYTTCQRTQTVN